MSEMTDDALNREIAQLIEPQESLPPARNHLHDNSPKGGWMHQQRFVRNAFEHSWHPRDFCNDSALTLMLMERLAGDGGFSLAGSAMGFSCCSVRTDKTSGCQETIGRCIALVFRQSRLK